MTTTSFFARLNSGFQQAKVQRLWKAAERSSFTGEELDELRSELLHFEAKLMKHEAVDEQVHDWSIHLGRVTSSPIG